MGYRELVELSIDTLVMYVRIYVAEFNRFTSIVSILVLMTVVSLILLFLLMSVFPFADFQQALLVALVICIALSVVVIVLSYPIYDRLAKSLKFVVSILKLEESGVLLLRRMKVVLGVLTIKVFPVYIGRYMYKTKWVSRKLSYISDARDLSEVKLSDIVVSGAGVGVIVEEHREYEWVSLPVLEIREKGFKTRLGSIVLGFVPKTSYTIYVGKGFLRASRGGDWAEVELNPSHGVLRGRLKYMKQPFQSESRGARVELEIRFDLSQLGFERFSVNRRVLKTTLVELKESGVIDFEFRLPEAPEPVVIVGMSSKLTTDDVLKALGLEAPTVFGEGWRYAEARLRLILDVPMGRDIVDETEVGVEPVVELG